MTALTPDRRVNVLRMELEGLLSSLIGTYTLPNGTTRPAVFVVGRQRVPADWKVSGAELTIQEVPEYENRDMVGDVMLVKIWPVRVINYSPFGAGSTLDEFQRRLLRTWPDCSPVYQPATDVSYEQLDVRIRDHWLTTLNRSY